MTDEELDTTLRDIEGERNNTGLLVVTGLLLLGLTWAAGTLYFVKTIGDMVFKFYGVTP